MYNSKSCFVTFVGMWFIVKVLLIEVGFISTITITTFLLLYKLYGHIIHLY